jgi:hypothetical protein
MRHYAHIKIDPPGCIEPTKHLMQLIGDLAKCRDLMINAYSPDGVIVESPAPNRIAALLFILFRIEGIRGLRATWLGTVSCLPLPMVEI